MVRERADQIVLLGARDKCVQYLAQDIKHLKIMKFLWIFKEQCKSSTSITSTYFSSAQISDLCILEWILSP